MKSPINYSDINMQDLLRWFNLSGTVQQYIIDQTTIYRPSLISNKLYGNIYYYPFIMIFNDIKDLTILTQGAVIYYPNINDIYSFVYSQQQRYSEEE